MVIPLGTLSVLIVIANCSVCAFVCSNKTRRTYSNWLILSLAISDILTGGVLLPLELTKPSSVATDYVTSAVLLSGVANICAVTYDRYVAILHPLAYPYRAPKLFKRAISVSWLIPAICSSLPLLWDADRTQTIHKVFMVCLQFLGVFVPYFFIIFAYVRIFRQVRRSLAMRKDLESRRERKNERERNSSDFQVAKVFFTVSIIFLFSWLPIIYMTTSKIILNRPEVIPEVLPTVSLFTVATSSLVNPLIYAFLKPDFKVVLRNFCRKSSQHAQGEAVSLRPNIPSPSCHLGIEQNTKHHDQTMGRKTEDIPTDSHAGILCVVDVHKI